MPEADSEKRNTGAGGTTGSESGPTTGVGGTTGGGETGAGLDEPVAEGDVSARAGRESGGEEPAAGFDLPAGAD